MKPGQERVIVTLIQTRQYTVLVVRQDSGGVTLGGAGGGGGWWRRRRRSRHPRFYQARHWVMSTTCRHMKTTYSTRCTAKTGGLPGLDAQNEVVIQRGYFQDFSDRDGVLKHIDHGPAIVGGQEIRIPMRMRPNEPPPFRPEDVVLQNGDIVFIEARDTELFYTGGMLGLPTNTCCRAITTSTWYRPSPWRTARCSTATRA